MKRTSGASGSNQLYFLKAMRFIIQPVTVGKGEKVLVNTTNKGLFSYDQTQSKHFSGIGSWYTELLCIQYGRQRQAISLRGLLRCVGSSACRPDGSSMPENPSNSLGTITRLPEQTNDRDGFSFLSH